MKHPEQFKKKENQQMWHRKVGIEEQGQPPADGMDFGYLYVELGLLKIFGAFKVKNET